MWVGMTTVVNDRLATDDKRFWLTEPKLAAYREVVESSGVFHDMDGVIDGACTILTALVVVLVGGRGRGAQGQEPFCVTPTITQPLKARAD